MATTTSKKPAAAKKPVAKKPAAKPAAVKKPAAKPAAAKKPAAVKKPAAKPAAAKKPAAVKKPAAKPAAAKKPAAAAKPAAVKKPAAAAKPDAVKKPAAAKKPVAVKKPIAEKKPAVKKQAVDAAEPINTNLRVMELFDAFMQEKLPRDHGYIVSAFFSDNSPYSIYEIVSYAGVKEIRATGTGLEFVTGGKRLSILVEPATYSFKHVEPVSRKEGDRIDKRYSELDIHIAKNQSKIMIAKEPNETYGSFTIVKPTGRNFSRILYNLNDVYNTLQTLFEFSFNKEAFIPQADAKIAAKKIADIVYKHMSFTGEFV